MAKAKVFVTHPLYPEAQQVLQASCECEFWSKPERPPREELLRRLKDKEAMVCLLTEKITDEVLRAALKLRILANLAFGYDNIQLLPCSKRGVGAYNTPCVLEQTPTAFTWA